MTHTSECLFIEALIEDTLRRPRPAFDRKEIPNRSGRHRSRIIETRAD